MWKEYNLGDLATFINGYAFKPSDWGREGLPIIRIQNLTNSSDEINYYNGLIGDKYIVEKGDILISWSASLGVYEWDDEKALLNQHIFKVVFDKIAIDKRFFVYLIKKELENMKRNTHGSTMKHITKKRFDNLRVKLPPLQTQNKIVEVLDKAQALIDWRKEQINLLDNLIQSIFYEMFGEPVMNPKEWKMAQLSKICSKIGSGATPRGGKASYMKEGISLIRSMNVHNGYFKFEELAYINDLQAEKLDNVSVENDDVLINITGASVTRSCIVPDNILPARVNQHVSILRPIDGMLDSYYLNYLLISKQFHEILMKIATSGGATREAITKKQLEKLIIPLPPIELQNKFAKIVQEIQSQKQLMEKSLTEIENNYNSIMQRAFKGELFS